MAVFSGAILPSGFLFARVTHPAVLLSRGSPIRDCSNAWVSVPVANPPDPPSAQAAVSTDPGDVRPPCPASAQADVPVANPSGPVDAPAVRDAEMSDEDYVPRSVSEADLSISSMDEAAASGDDEVVTAVLSLSPSGSPRRRRKRRRRTVSSAVPCQLVDMDISVEEVSGHKQFKTFRGVWEDKITWEEFRAGKPLYRVNVIPAEPSPSPTPSLSQSFSATSSTPVPPDSRVPSSFSSNGSVVDSVPTPTPERSRVHYQSRPRFW